MIDDPLGLPDDGPDPPLSFAWESLPRLDCKPGGYRSISETAVWTTGLRDGQSIHLSSLSQHLTYGGVLAGLPLDDATRSWPLRNAIEGAAAQFGIEPYRVCVLPPVLLRSVVRRQENGELKDLVIDFLPPISCTARFYSSRPVNDHDADGSSAVVVWFQRSFGPPEAGHVTEQLQAIDWARFGVDWNW